MEEKKQSLVPELRFPGFEGEWKVKKLGEIADRCALRNKDKTVTRVLTNSATEGVVDQNAYFERDIAVKENTDNYHVVDVDDFVYNPRISASAPVGPISRNKIGRGIMSPLYSVFRFKSENIDYLEQFFSTTIWHKYLKEVANYGARFDRMAISTEDFYSMPILLPSLPEQQKIADCLSSVDHLIQEETDQLQALKDHKKGLMQQLFPQDGETTPKRRFPGFEGKWEEKKFKDITFAAGKKNKQNLPYERYSISNELGFYPQSNQFDGGGGYLKNIDCSLYIIVPPHTFAYNPARINVGSIGYQDLGKDVIVSSLYEVFQTTDCCDDNFLWHWFHSDIFHRMIMDVQEGGVRQYFFYDKLCGCSILLPTLSEQQKIAECLSSLDEEISAQQQKVEALKEHKKGLIQKLFPAIN